DLPGLARRGRRSGGHPARSGIRREEGDRAPTDHRSYSRGRRGLCRRHRPHHGPAGLGLVSNAEGEGAGPGRHPSSLGVEVKRIVRLTVNGLERDVMVEPHHTLLDVLCRDFDLMSVREGCGVGMCDACTVLADGKPVSSCLTLPALAHRQDLVTLEGLMEAGDL